MKLNYINYSLLRKMFLFKKNKIFKLNKKIIYNRSSRVPPLLIGYNVWIYSGKKLNVFLINKWTVGFKFGEFTWNKKIALYKAKSLKKKKKK